MKLVAINDPGMTVELMVYLFVHDSVYGTFPGTVQQLGDSTLAINGHNIVIHTCKDPSQIPWGNCDFVLESSGCFTTTAHAMEHCKGGAKRVIISAPGKDNTPIYVMVSDKSI